MKQKSFCEAIYLVIWTKQQPIEWEKIFINSTFNKRLKSKIYKELKNQTSRKQPNWKMGYKKILNRRNLNGWEILYSTFLATREVQIKTTLRFQLILVRMAKINNTSDRKLMLARMLNRGTLSISGRSANMCSHNENQCMVPQEDGNRSTSRSCCTTLGHIPKGHFILPQNTCLIMFIATSLHQKMETN